WGLLLSAPLYLLRRRAAVCALATVEYRCVSGLRGGIGAHREADSGGVARGEDHASRRLGILPGRADEVVRRSGGRLCAGAGEERAPEGRDRRRTGRGGSRVSADGESGTAVQGVPLSDAGQLVAGAAGGGQGRVFGEGREPALCGDLVGAGSLGSAPFVRRVVLRAGRDGEPHQGAVDAVCGSDQRGVPAQQPDPAVLLLDRLPAAGGVAPAGLEGDRASGSLLRVR